MTRRHVLWVNQFAITPADGGGTRHFEFARALSAGDWDVTVVASDFHLQSRRFTRRGDPGNKAVVDEVIEGVRFQWAWSFPYAKNDWRRIINWLSFGWEVVWRAGSSPGPDVVIGSSPQLFAALGAWALAWRRKAAFVFEVRDLWPESLEAVTGRRGIGYYFLGAIARFLYRRADRIIVLASGSARVIESLGISADRICYIPNGVDPDTFPVTVHSHQDRITAIYAGAHGPANGLDAVVEAAALLSDRRDIRFVLVGDGPVKADLMAHAQRLGLQNIEFKAPVAKSELAKLLAEADAGLMVLRDTPLFAWGISPNKLFDYLAAELPVVCNVRGDVAQMLNAAGAGEQAADSSPAALADALRRMAALTSEGRRTMGQAGRRWVLQEHNRTLLAARVDRLLSELVPR